MEKVEDMRGGAPRTQNAIANAVSVSEMSRPLARYWIQSLPPLQQQLLHSLLRDAAELAIEAWESEQPARARMEFFR